MRKTDLRTAAAALTALAVLLAIKSFAPATAMHQAAPTTARTSALRSNMMAIVPAPVIEKAEKLFVGTGDASGSNWIKP